MDGLQSLKTKCLSVPADGYLGHKALQLNPFTATLALSL